MEEERSNDQNNERMEEYRKKLMQEQQKKLFLRQVLEEKAYERIMNVRLSSPETYQQVYSLLTYLAQQGQIKGKVSEEKLLALMQKMREKKETKISFARK